MGDVIFIVLTNNLFLIFWEKIEFTILIFIEFCSVLNLRTIFPMLVLNEKRIIQNRLFSNNRYFDSSTITVILTDGLLGENIIIPKKQKTICTAPVYSTYIYSTCFEKNPKRSGWKMKKKWKVTRNYFASPYNTFFTLQTFQNRNIWNSNSTVLQT